MNKIASVKLACQITAKTFKKIAPFLIPPITEKKLASKIKNTLSSFGSQKLSFPIIVAFGPNSTRPHHKPTNRKLIRNDTALIDFGCKINGFCSDMTRTFFIGFPTPIQLKVKTTIKAAYQKALQILKDGQKVSSVDSAARKIITQAGFGKYFIHSTGHGIGRKIHQAPSIKTGSKQILKKDMIITIEPGIYIPNQFGYRHENTILITQSSSKQLTVC